MAYPPNPQKQMPSRNHQKMCIIWCIFNAYPLKELKPLLWLKHLAVVVVPPYLHELPFTIKVPLVALHKYVVRRKFAAIYLCMFTV